MPPKAKPLSDRFWSRVERKGPDDCWEWTGSRLPCGYGQIQTLSRVPARTHRLSWELANGPIPDGLHVLHKCDNPPCVNPSHLFLGTPKENSDDKIAKGRQGEPRRPKGENNHESVLTDNGVRYLRAQVSSGRSCADLARELGVSASAAVQASRGVTWRHVV